MKTFVLFFSGALIFGVVTLALGYILGDSEILLQGLVAFALAFVPSATTLAWVLRSFRTTPDMQLIASLGGSGIRMAIALGGGWLLTWTQPHTFDMTLWCWLLLYYLGLLGFEIALLIRQQPAELNPVRDNA